MTRFDVLASDLVRGVGAVFHHTDQGRDAGVRACVKFSPGPAALTVTAADFHSAGLSRIVVTDQVTDLADEFLVAGKEIMAALSVFGFRREDAGDMVLSLTLDARRLRIAEAGGLFETKAVDLEVETGQNAVDQFTDVPQLIGSLWRSRGGRLKVPDPAYVPTLMARFAKSAKSIGSDSYAIERTGGVLLCRISDVFIGYARTQPRDEDQQVAWDQTTRMWDVVLPPAPVQLEVV